MAAQQRIYIVSTPDGNTRLVRAAMRQQALSHVAASLLEVRVASQDDLVAEVSRGVKVEDYRSSEQAELIEESESPAN